MAVASSHNELSFGQRVVTNQRFQLFSNAFSITIVLDRPLDVPSVDLLRTLHLSQCLRQCSSAFFPNLGAYLFGQSKYMPCSGS